MMNDDLLRSLYDDMFGTSSGSSGRGSDRGSSGSGAGKGPGRGTAGNRPDGRKNNARPAGRPVTDKPKAPAKKPVLSEDDAVKNAQDALSEAKNLLKDMDEQLAIPAGPGGSDGGAEAEAPQEPEKDPMEELDQLIGLESIKSDVKELMDFVKIQKMRKDQGLKSVPVSLHLVFTGNPGTGKTTVARIIGRLYKQIGVLSKGQLVETDRSGLVAGFVGQTALKTQEKIKAAMGGVLFIDEAYALTSNEQDTFGQESVDTILKAMEDHRDDLVVIVAGYTAPMEKFINSNPGLKSRFNKYIEFPDYTTDELEQIFYMNCEKYDYVVEEEVKHQIRSLIVLRKLQQLENFANAREVRNMFEEIITNQARRVAAMENPTQEDMMKITLEDLVERKEDEKKSDSSESAGEKADSDGEAADEKTGSDSEPADKETDGSDSESAKDKPAGDESADSDSK
ncbi:MAG: AAA family ATPase [Lachnospiraceae bacterium]|nr:AAA family ATPase [Lachnospiraceae bacterium]